MLPVIGVVLYAWQSGSTPSQPTHLRLGARASSTAQVELVWRRAGEDRVAHDVTYRFAKAPEDVYRTVRLASGDYDVSVRLVHHDGREELSTMRVRADADHPLTIDLDPRPSR